MNVDKSGQRVRRMFAAISPRYDFLNHLLSCGCDFYWRRYTVRTVPPNGDDPILDVCTGTGDLAFAYWRAGGRHIRVVATDFTHEMLQRANRKLSNQPTEEDSLHRGAASALPQFLEADTQHLPFPDGRFQIVSVAFGLRNVADTGSGLREMVRVCRPGGRIAILEFSMPHNRLLRALYSWYFGSVLPWIGQRLARNQEAAYNYLPASVQEFPQGSDLAELMRQSGLAQVTWKPLTFGVAMLYCGVKADGHEPGA